MAPIPEPLRTPAAVEDMKAGQTPARRADCEVLSKIEPGTRLRVYPKIFNTEGPSSLDVDKVSRHMNVERGVVSTLLNYALTETRFRAELREVGYSDR